MPKFRDLNGSVIEVSDEHAEQVLRPQGQFKEVFEDPKPVLEVKVEDEVIPDEEIPKPSKKKQSKKKSKKKE